MSETEKAPRGRSVMESMIEAQRELNRMAMEDPEGYMRAVAGIVAERTERRYMKIVESCDVPPGEVHVVQGGRIVGKIVNLELPE